MLGICAVPGDVVTTSEAVSHELVDPRAFHKDDKFGSSRPGGTGVKRKLRESADSIAEGGYDDIPLLSHRVLEMSLSREVRGRCTPGQDRRPNAHLIRVAESLIILSLGYPGLIQAGGHPLGMRLTAVSISLERLLKVPRSIWSP